MGGLGGWRRFGDAGSDQSLDVERKLPLVFGQDLRDAAAEHWPIRVNDQELAVDDAITVQLDLDLDPIAHGERKVGAKTKAALRQIQHLAEHGSLVVRQEPPPLEGEPEMVSLILHRTRPFKDNLHGAAVLCGPA